MSSVALVCMPWQLLASPSIQIGTLSAMLRREGVDCALHSLHLAFFDELARRQVPWSFEDYAQVCNRWSDLGLGEWIFAVATPRAGAAERDRRYLELVRRRGIEASFLERVERVRREVPSILERFADEVLAGTPSVVGFTTTFPQITASAALARVLKARQQELRIVFGGASCEGPMGPALMRAFPEIDVVVRGEAEGVFPALARELAEGRSPSDYPGVCRRANGELAIDDRDAPSPAMSSLPTPEYDEYFARLAHSTVADRVLPWLPFESARGCWWGEKAHCTFCGLNGRSMRFRSKPMLQVADELDRLSRRHQVLDFSAVDNIIDLDYLDDLLPELARRGADLRIFYETKANLTREQVRKLRLAGVRAIQPGIESLSTPILKLMKKGVSAIQNVRLLKWCREEGIHVVWNLLWGFPGESPDEYARMAELAPSLVHLAAPNSGKLMVDRFSPYFDRPAEFGIELVRPLRHYETIFDVDGATLADLAYSFEYRHLDGRSPESYAQPLLELAARWRRDEELNRGALTYRRGADFVIIADRRSTVQSARYTLEGLEAAIFLGCDAGANVAQLHTELATKHGLEVAEPDIVRVLDEFLAARLVFHDAGRYLSLPIDESLSAR